MKTLGEKIRDAREAANLSQEEVAKACGVTREAVSAWESGDSRPRASRWRDLMRSINLRPDDFTSDMTADIPASNGSDTEDNAAPEHLLNARIMRELGRTVMDSCLKGDLEMTPEQFGRLVETIYLRIQEFPPAQRQAQARTVLRDLTALLKKD